MIRASLATHGAAILGTRRLTPLIRAVAAFGFHLASLDLRQNADVHDGLGVALLTQGKAKESLEGFDRAVKLGPALDSLKLMYGMFDLCFIDADKEGYVDYYEAVLPRLSERGLIVADNTLWSGRVVDEASPIAAFNEHVAADPRSVQVVLSVRDGMTLIRKA